MCYTITTEVTNKQKTSFITENTFKPISRLFLIFIPSMRPSISTFLTTQLNLHLSIQESFNDYIFIHIFMNGVKYHHHIHN